MISGRVLSISSILLITSQYIESYAFMRLTNPTKVLTPFFFFLEEYFQSKYGVNATKDRCNSKLKRDTIYVQGFLEEIVKKNTYDFRDNMDSYYTC